MFEAEGRPRQTRAAQKSELAGAHRPEGQIGLAEASLRASAALERANHNRPQRPAELRFPDQVDVAELGLDAKIAVAAGAQLAEAAIEPASLTIDADEPHVA